MRSRIVGTGSYLPHQVVTNAELAKRVDTSDEWIYTRTGIRQRHIAAEEERTSDLALAAAREALAAAQIAPQDVDLIVLATTTPDVIFPSTACILQAKLGARNGPALAYSNSRKASRLESGSPGSFTSFLRGSSISSSCRVPSAGGRAAWISRHWRSAS